MKTLMILATLAAACGGPGADPDQPKDDPNSCADFIQVCRDTFGEDAYALWCPGQPSEGDVVWTEGSWCIVPAPRVP